MNPTHRDIMDTHDQIDEVDVLISRLIDGKASDNDIESFVTQAGTDSRWIQALAERQNDHTRLTETVNGFVTVADAVHLPLADVESPSGDSSVVDSDPKVRVGVIHIIRPAASYLGWAAAIALTLFIALWQPQAPPAQFINLEAVQPHILEEREGRPLEPVLIHSEKLPDSRFEFTIIERRLMKITADHFDEQWINEQPADDADARIKGF